MKAEENKVGREFFSGEQRTRNDAVLFEKVKWKCPVSKDVCTQNKIRICCGLELKVQHEFNDEIVVIKIQSC